MMRLLVKFKRIWFNLCHPVIGEVWQLHHVTSSLAPNEAMKPYYIIPERLERLILEYRRKGYDFISLDDLFKPRKHKFIAVTLDDGYEDNYLEAWPLFKKLSVPFCIFVATDFVFEDSVRTHEKGMTIQQLKELSVDSLCTIGGHTKSHVNLLSISEQELNNEIMGCKKIIEESLNIRVSYFSYPFGVYSESLTRVMANCCITAAFAAWGGPLRKGIANRFAINRILV